MIIWSPTGAFLLLAKYRYQVMLLTPPSNPTYLLEAQVLYRSLLIQVPGVIPLPVPHEGLGLGTMEMFTFVILEL
jgi:hypothetical protein